MSGEAHGPFGSARRGGSGGDPDRRGLGPEFSAHVDHRRNIGGERLRERVRKVLRPLDDDAEFYAWSGFFAPAKTPQLIIDKVNASMNAALEQPEMKKALMATGLEVVGGKPEVLTEMRCSYIGATREIGRQNNIVLE